MVPTAAQDADISSKVFRWRDWLWRPWYAKCWLSVALGLGSEKLLGSPLSDGFIESVPELLLLCFHPFAVAWYVAIRSVWYWGLHASFPWDVPGAETKFVLGIGFPYGAHFKHHYPTSFLSDPSDPRSPLNPSNPTYVGLIRH